MPKVDVEIAEIAEQISPGYRGHPSICPVVGR